MNVQEDILQKSPRGLGGKAALQSVVVTAETSVSLPRISVQCSMNVTVGIKVLIVTQYPNSIGVWHCS